MGKSESVKKSYLEQGLEKKETDRVKTSKTKHETGGKKELKEETVEAQIAVEFRLVR